MVSQSDMGFSQAQSNHERMHPWGPSFAALSSSSSVSHLSVIAIATLVCATFAAYELSGSNVFAPIVPWPKFFGGAVLVGVLAATFMALEARLANDKAWIARTMTYVCGAFIVLITSTASIPFAVISVVSTYASSATQQPLQDAMLASIDAAVGFDWMQFLKMVNTPWTAAVLQSAYNSLYYQPTVILALLFLLRRPVTMLELTAFLVVSLLITKFILALVPAEGAYAYYKPLREQYSFYPDNAGQWHHSVLQHLRSGQPFQMEIGKTTGIVTFPSFHTASAIVMTYAMRKIWWFFWPLALLNATMIVSTIPSGGHHLVDVFAGAAVALTAICVVTSVENLVRSRHSL